MKISHILMVFAGLMLAGNALAGDGAATFKKSNCTACHHADKKTVGPALKDIAAKYKADAGATDKLAAKVRKGGAGNWGTMPMPPTPASVSDADIKDMVQWILAR